MSFLKVTAKFAALGAALFLTACSLQVTAPEIKADINIPGLNNNTANSTAVLSCTAVPQGVNNSTIPANQPLAILVTAVGGTGPYKVFGQSGNFASTRTISRTYGNNTSSDIAMTDAVAILDASGTSAQCDFDITVTPASSPQALACTITANPASPSVNQNVVLSAVATGGTAPYTFGAIQLGTGGSVVGSPVTTPTSLTTTAVYNSIATRIVSVGLIDSLGNSASCNQSVVVHGTPTVTLSKSASSVNVGQSIVVTASISQFLSAVSYTFTSSDSNVGISQNGTAQATVFSLDNNAHPNVTITVVASNASESATNNTQVSFTVPTPPAALQCNIQHSAAVVGVNQTNTFTIQATNGGALTISGIDTNGGSLVSQTSNSIGVRFATAGVKTIQLRAFETSTGRQCANGAWVQDSITVTAANLACSIYTTYNPSYVYENIAAIAVPNGGTGSVYLEKVVISYFGGTTTIFNNFQTLSIGLQFLVSGSYPMTGTVRDSAGNTSTCSMTQVVY